MSDVLGVLWRANVAVSGVIILMMLLRRPVRRRFGPQLAFNLWLAAPVALLAPASPQPARPFPAPIAHAASMIAPPDIVWLGAAHAAGDPTGLIVAVWAVGAAVSLILLIGSQRAFLRKAAAGLAGPAVVGVIFPRIILPANFETRFNEGERRMILAHERAHLARRDAQVIGVAALIRCVCWFNPLVHLAVRLARLDQELACDAHVLAQRPQDRRLYAEALLRSQYSTLPLSFGCSWPARPSHPLEERIAMLKQVRPSKAWRRSGVALAAIFILGAGLGAWSVRAAPSGPAVAAHAALSGTAGLTMRLVDETGAPGDVRVASPDGGLWLKPQLIISRDMVAHATARLDERGGAVVSFNLTPEGRSRFAQVTGDNVGRRIAILIDGRVMSAPVVRDRIAGGAGEISGRFTLEEAKALAAAISPSAGG